MLRVVVIDSSGAASEAQADVVIICDQSQGVPVALARSLDQQIEFISIEDRELFLSRLRQVVSPEILASLVTREPQVRSVE